MDDWVEVETALKDPAAVDPPAHSPTYTRSTDIAIPLYSAIQQEAQRRLESSSSPIFHVDLGSGPLHTTIRDNLPEHLRKEYICSTCDRFTKNYGDLALVNDDGTLEPLLWCLDDLNHGPGLSAIFGPAYTAVIKRFSGSKVTREFTVSNKRRFIGRERKGGFSHFHLHFPASRVTGKDGPGVSSASAAASAAMLDRILAKYKLKTVEKAYSMLSWGRLPYADNHKASCKWLLELMRENKVSVTDRTTHEHHNLLYRYAASAFTGSLKQLNTGALSTLLSNIEARAQNSRILNEWHMICDPGRYMRPQAPPSAGNVAAAEKLFEELGITKQDLRRRLLVQDDVPDEVVMWSSERMKKRQKPGDPSQDRSLRAVFAAVKTKPDHKFAGIVEGVTPLPAVTMTFTEFVTTVLPRAKQVECWLDREGSISTLITGLPGSKPLMQWHDQQGKNLASNYVWLNRPRVEQHKLKASDWNEVRCLIPHPWLWDGVPQTTTLPLADPETEANANKYKYYHKQKGFRYLFVFEDGQETKFKGLPIFPEYLKTEFHGVRSTIEAFCETEVLEDVVDGLEKGGFVSGIDAPHGKMGEKLKFRVLSFQGDVKRYHIRDFD